MRPITLKWLKRHRILHDTTWYTAQNTTDLPTLFALAIKDKKYYFINSVLLHLMSKTQRVQFTLHSIKPLMEIFEQACPGNTKPQEIITAIESYLDHPCKKTKRALSTAYDNCDVVEIIKEAPIGMASTASCIAYAAKTATRVITVSANEGDSIMMYVSRAINNFTLSTTPEKIAHRIAQGKSMAAKRKMCQYGYKLLTKGE